MLYDLPLTGFVQNIGPMQLVLVLVIVLIIFGPKKLPGLGKALGASIKEFRDSVKGLGNILEEEPKEDHKTASPPAAPASKQQATANGAPSAVEEEKNLDNA